MAPNILGTVAIPARPHPKWAEVRDHRLKNLPLDAKGLKGLDLVRLVDRWVNDRIEYTLERLDQWALPADTLKSGNGDCEDIVLLKRAILLLTGIPDDALYLTIATDLISRQQHALGLYRDESGGFWIMDNFNSLLLPNEKVRDYAPIQTQSASRGWIHGKSR